MRLSRLAPAAACAWLSLWSVTGSAEAAELIMVEEDGCHYCIEWKQTLGPIYPKTAEGRFAPLRMVDVDDGAPEGVTFARSINFTPTFVLVEQGQELARIEGHPGEDFFWGLLNMILKEKTDFAQAAETD
ncbi:thioredoxin family protein [Roseovarius sp. TE539]|uniref:thioredoxin family protein n=1 Tax=Roseovarius sp. TE539 TaxID=2249812 RepID=UPI000DDE5AF8|nr:thioredoxin family protein [Roseovarius sp. TE539]RBI74564.1 thioredoxin family protein [Roseovarius sp. TE539]